jgi:hypothetical protein
MLGDGLSREVDHYPGVPPESLRDLIEVYDREVAMLERRVHQLFRDDRGYQAIQKLDGVGRTLGRSSSPRSVTSAGSVLRKRCARRLGARLVIASPTPRWVRGKITKQGSKLVRRRWKRSSATTAAHRYASTSIASRNDAAPTRRASRPRVGS